MKMCFEHNIDSTNGCWGVAMCLLTNEASGKLLFKIVILTGRYH